MSFSLVTSVLHAKNARATFSKSFHRCGESVFFNVAENKVDARLRQLRRGRQFRFHSRRR